jgi:3-hydroxyacyl-CoA dehydrogenase
MILAGYYGKKSGKGFYDYSGDNVVPNELGI